MTASADVLEAGLGGRKSMSLGEAARLFFSFAGPPVIAVTIAVTVALRIWVGGFSTGDVVVLVVIPPIWALQEWFAHKHILHIKPFALFGVKVDPYFPKEHRAHHRAPWELRRALLPLRVLLVAVPSASLLFWLVMPSLQLALTAMAAYSTMALLYEWTHYLTHTPYRPRTGLYRRIFKNHRLHHFKNENYWYGFIIPFVDDLFGTAPDQKAVETSPSCRTLGVEE